MNQHELAGRAYKVLPAGSFGNFDSGVIIRRGKGSRIWDMDGNEYVDLLLGSGPMVLGHCHPEVVEAVQEQLGRGTTFFANNEYGIALAEEICNAVACAEKVRFLSSGGEATMYAMRLARAYSGRERIVKFEGGYHGMSAEAQMSLAPKNLAEFPNAVPDSAGIPESLRKEMLIAPFNDFDYISYLLDEFREEIAAVIVEPVQRTILPASGFLQHLRDECDKFGIVLIFDEVVTGFRLAYGGAQEFYGVTPDLTTLGKIIGGGFPLAAVTGKSEIMKHFDLGKVGTEGFLLQIGTLSGNPVASVAGLKTLEIMKRPGQYQKWKNNGKRVMGYLTQHLSSEGHAHQISGFPMHFNVIFDDPPMVDYRAVFHSDKNKSVKFEQLLREKHVFKSPGKFYISLALGDADMGLIDRAVAYAAKNLQFQTEIN